MNFFEIMFKDPLEAKKEGYAEAAKEYVPAFNNIRREYRRVIAYYKEKKENYKEKTDEMLLHMKDMEQQRDKLKKELDSKIVDSSHILGVSETELTAALSGGTVTALLLLPLPFLFPLFLLDKKTKQLEEARREGYDEARALYIKKIRKLKKKLKELREEGDSIIDRYDEMISRMLDEMAEISLKIANLKITLARMEESK